MAEKDDQWENLDYQNALTLQNSKVHNILDLSLLYACVILKTDLAERIANFGRSLKYLLGISM